MAGIGDIVEGTVTSVMPFGAFVTFGSKESGLVHISEISAEYVKDINSVVKRGDRVKAKVIKIDDDGKISLSIKQAAAAPEIRLTGQPAILRNFHLKTGYCGLSMRARRKYATQKGVWRASVRVAIPERAIIKL